MSAPPAKRSRVDSSASNAGLNAAATQATDAAADAPVITLAEIEKILRSLPADTLLNTLLRAATEDSCGTVERIIKAEHEAFLLKESKLVYNFDGYSKQAWNLLNRNNSHLRGSAQYEAAFDVGSDIDKMFGVILKTTKLHSSYKTKLSAAETMRKITKSILLSNGITGHEVRKDSHWWNGRLLDLFAKFHPEDLSRLASDGNGEWLGKLRELADLAGQYAEGEKLRECVEILEGCVEDEEDKDTDGDEGEMRDEDQ